ncbi:MAG: T9SS type A sorting domain-containing protein, partial [Rhodothermales bacterium]
PTTLSVSGTITPDPVRERGHGEVTIGTQNMEHLFSSDGDFADRLIKLSKLVREVLGAPDILAVQEVGDLATLTSLATKIGIDDPTITYTAFLEEGNDVGGIDVGFLVRGTVKNIVITQLGKTETFIDPTDSSVDILHDRPPLLLEGDFDLGGLLTPIAVMGVHNRSFIGIDDPFDGERVRAKRLAQANSIAVKVQALQVADPDVRLVVTGDFNAFQFTDGFVDVVGRIAGNFVDADDLVTDPTDHVNPDLTNQVLSLPSEERYSFIFGGNSQVLDHMLTSEALGPIVSGIEYGRANADAPDAFGDITTTSLRASDHDGLVLYLTPQNFVFLAEKKIKIDGQTLSEGNIHSNEKVEFGKGKGKGKGSSTHTGDLSAVDKIKIEKDQTIDGDATAPTVEVKAGAMVTGTVTEGPVAPVPLPTLSFTAGGDNIKVKKDETLPLAPGSYGDVKVEDRATLELTTGVYFFKKLELKKEATLSVDVAAGAVEVNVVGKVKLDKKAAVALVSAGAAGSRLFTVNSLENKNIELKEESVFFGTIIAPEAKVKIEKEAFFKGAICAEEIDVKKDVTFVPHGSSVLPPAALPSVLADEVGEGSPEALEAQGIPTEFALAPNYPNPFNPTTTIEFALPEAVEVSLRVYDVTGRVVARLVERPMAAGHHRVQFNASRLASGLYLYRIQAGRFTQVRRMILLK